MTKVDEILSIVKELAKESKEHTRILKEHEVKFQQIDKKFEHMDKKFEQMDQKISKMDQKINEMDKKIDMNSNRLDEHDERFERIFRSLAIIEEAVTVKIPALFDGLGFHQDHLERHDKAIENLESKSENHSIRLISLEYDSKEYAKQLANLTSLK